MNYAPAVEPTESYSPAVRPRQHAVVEQSAGYQQAKSAWEAAKQAHRARMDGITDPAQQRAAQQEFAGTRNDWRAYQVSQGKSPRGNARTNPWQVQQDAYKSASREYKAAKRAAPNQAAQRALRQEFNADVKTPWRQAQMDHFGGLTGRQRRDQENAQYGTGRPAGATGSGGGSLVAGGGARPGAGTGGGAGSGGGTSPGGGAGSGGSGTGSQAPGTTSPYPAARDGSPTTSFPSPTTGNTEMDQYRRQYDTEYNRYFAKEEDFERRNQGQYTASGNRIAGSIWG